MTALKQAVVAAQLLSNCYFYVLSGARVCVHTGGELLDDDAHSSRSVHLQDHSTAGKCLWYSLMHRDLLKRE
jgi:hypothetical protein